MFPQKIENNKRAPSIFLNTAKESFRCSLTLIHFLFPIQNAYWLKQTEDDSNKNKNENSNIHNHHHHHLFHWMKCMSQLDSIREIKFFLVCLEIRMLFTLPAKK